MPMMTIAVMTLRSKNDWSDENFALLIKALSGRYP